MIITTKGLKTDDAGQDEGQGQSRQPSEAKSRLPYYLGLAVASVAAYLKSFLPEPARAEPEPEGGGGEPSRASSAKPTLLLVSDDRQDEELPDERARGSSGLAPEMQMPAAEYEDQGFVRAHSLRFAAPEPRPDLGDFKPSPVIPNPINDNRGSAPISGGGGGSGGHGRGQREPPSRGDAVSHPHPDDGSVGSSPDKTDGRSSDPREAAGDESERVARTDGAKGPNTGDRSGGGDGPKPGGSADDGSGGEGPSPTGPVAPGEPTGGRRNRAPVSTGTVHLADTTRSASLTIAAFDLLRTVSDPDGDALSVGGVTASSGTLARDGDGWLFDADEVGPVTFTYAVTDGEFTITQTATLNVVDRTRDPGTGSEGTPVDRTGTNGDDLILGTPFRDLISGGGGNDNIDARGGDDLIDGGQGDDHIVGGGGDDTILGGPGRDVILAGAGRDVVSGGAGDDRIFGEDGDDTLFGDEGDDVVEGGTGSDILVGGTGDDILDGGEGDDRIEGGDGNDIALAGAGRDVMSGDAGDDRLEGGEGADLISDGTGRDLVLGQGDDDILVAALDGEVDVFDGGAGVDTLDLSATTMGVVLDLTAGTADGAETGRDRVASIEVVRGGSGDDTVIGDAGSNVLSGGDGDDHLAGRQGNDVLEGGSGRDRILDGTGRDVVRGGDGDDVIVLAMDGDDDSVDGGEGTDTLDLSGATGDLIVDLVRQVVSGTELGEDKIESIERMVAGSGSDRFVIGGGDVVLTGGGGDDGYEFSSRGGDPEPTRAVQITDFSVGDHIDLLKWTFFEELPGAEGASLAEALERKDGTVSGIRYKSAHLDDGDVTVISADLDHDGLFETTIALDGQHTLLFMAATPAQPPVTPLT